ncbi:MAG: proprotein convertase P-domain-containing protein [Planctomycetota bacterium]|jgi:subtilisin-like proprotein convertase family protein
MNSGSRCLARWSVVIGAAVLAASGPAATPSAMTKEQMHEQMIAIAAQMAELKAGGQVREQYARLRDRYRALSDALGGDDPGRILGGAGDGVPPQRAGGVVASVPVPPLGCAMTEHVPWVSTTALPINDFQVTTSTILVSGAGTDLWEIDFTAAIQHTHSGDLAIALTSPEGTEVTVSTHNGGSNDDVFNGTVWDDDAGDQNPPGPVTDTAFANLVVATPLVVEEALGAFRHEDPNGVWQLEIYDDGALDTGLLNGWAIGIATIDAPQSGLVAILEVRPEAPIADLATTISTIDVSSITAPISYVGIQTEITHSFAADLDITLTSPAGTVVTLTTDNGGGNDNVFSQTWWRDNVGVANPPGPVTDTIFEDQVNEWNLVPEEAEGAFYGENPNGVWTLAVYDDAPGDTGVLHAWELDVGFFTCSCPGQGDCYGANGTPGCDHTDCCLSVCSVDPSCCETAWDASCAALACERCANVVVNDDCASATVIGEGSTQFSTVCATTDGPAHDACLGAGDDHVHNDVWFAYTATCTGGLIVSTCGTVTDFDTRIAVYEATGCPVSDSNLLACNDDAPGCPNYTSEAVAAVIAGREYKIRVGGYNGATGTGDLNLTCMGLPTTAGINPRATYLHTASDSPNDPDPFPIWMFGFQPGDVIRIERLGDWDNGPGGDTYTNMSAVFSAGTAILPPQELHRVPGAVDAGPEAITPCTHYGCEPTDIPEDFPISHPGWTEIVIEVPAGATDLFFSTVDSLYGDNTDPDGDYAVRISKVLCPWDCQSTPDGQVNVPDFLAILAQWGQVGVPCDFDGSGVGVTEFLELLAHWGPCP